MANVVFGDNHLFGINHLSLEKADEYKKKYSNSHNLAKVFEFLKRNDVNDQMISAHATASEVCEIALENHSNLRIHPVIPYAHAINDDAAAHGVIKTAFNLLQPTLLDMLKLCAQAVSPWHNIMLPRSSVERFVKKQIELFGNLPDGNKGVLFVNNVFCDLIIGMGLDEWFDYFVSVSNELGYEAGVITYNPSYFLKNRISNIQVCINTNHLGFLNNIDRTELDELVRCYDVWAMGVFGSGAYHQDDVIAYLQEIDFNSVIFASSKEERLHTFLELFKGTSK
jgi:hypothetical protein